MAVRQMIAAVSQCQEMVGREIAVRQMIAAVAHCLKMVGREIIYHWVMVENRMIVRYSHKTAPGSMMDRNRTI
jgi:hypothetical protein